MCVYVYIYVYKYKCMYIYMYVYIYISINVCVYIYVVSCNMCNVQWKGQGNTFHCDCRTRLERPGGCGTWRKGLCR